MIVDAAWYVDGRRTLETDSIEKLAAERGGAGFGWLGLRMPTDAELDEVRDAFELPELAIADARNKHDRPKVERHEDCLLTVVPTARYVDEREEVEFGELFFYAGRDYILTVRYGQAAPLSGVRHELEEQPDRLAHGPGAVLQAALFHVVESYVPVIEGLEHDVREVERDVFSESRDATDEADLLPHPRGARLPRGPRADVGVRQAADVGGVHDLGEPRDRPVVP